MRLNNPYLFQERLEKKEPNIFLTLRNGKFDGYSRMCPSAAKRQPVILTSEEMQDMYKENKDVFMGNFKDGEYDGPDALKYGSKPDSSFYYMCPRYWCLLTNKALTQKQIDAGECGGKESIIPKGDKTVKKGKYIYQFYDDKTTHYPGFHKENTPNGLCIPCCYDSWNKPAQSLRRAKCKGDVEQKKNEEQIKESDEYIKGPEKYPLGENRWGYLPFAIEKFLQEVNSSCQISKTNTNIKPFHTCILRHGVENSENQSFIACIANALFYADKDDATKQPRITKFIPDAKYDVPSIDIMKDLLLTAIDLDKFITYQNGDLISSFANDSLEINESLYHGSKLFAKIQHDGVEQKKFFKRAIQSYENFTLFIKNKTALIDYTYLWDIICKPNPLLFENGINLFILEILNNDMTNNVELICPTNHYSSQFYDPKKRTLILLKHDQFFEPIYSYRNEEKRFYIVKTFSEYDPNLSKSLRRLFRTVIKPIMKEKCRPFSSRSEIYKFKTPILLDELIPDVIKRGYTVEKQVLNFQGKVIGIIARNSDKKSGFIPCYPSSLTTIQDKKCSCDYGFVYMNESTLWKTYDETLSFLKEYYKYKEPDNDTDATKCIDGTDLCKVVEDKMIVGFLTKTNQFVQISPPVPESNSNDQIRKITNNDYLIADIETQVNTNVDSKRVDYIKRIELETSFYNVFRNTIRILLNDYINSEKRKQLQEESNKKFVLYDTQLEIIILLLKQLCNGYILFATKDDGFDYQSIKELYTCISLPPDKCSNQSICKTTNDKCSIVIPKNNLLTGADNENYYYGRMADELIRYNRIKTFLFQPQTYLSFGQLKYNLRDDEIIILQSLLNNEFFDELIPSEINSYAKYNTFDSAEPLITQAFSNEVILNENMEKKMERDCVAGKPIKIISTKWSKCFPSTYKEIEYKGSKYCGYYLIIDIVKKYTNEDLSIESIKDILVEEYKKYIRNDKTNFYKIVEIMIEQGKIGEGKELKIGVLDLLELIMAEGYALTNFDLWILLRYFKIPSILISNFPIAESRFTDLYFVCQVNPINTESEYVFIRVPTLKEDSIPSFQLIVSNDTNTNKIKIPLSSLECKNDIINAINNSISIEDYIMSYQRNVKGKKKVAKAKPNELIEEANMTFQIEPAPKKKRRSKKNLVIVTAKTKKKKPIFIIEENV